MLLQNATLGEQEAVFEEVILLMEQGMDIDSGSLQQQRSSSYNTYKYLQQKLNRINIQLWIHIKWKHYIMFICSLATMISAAVGEANVCPRLLYMYNKHV
jgi:hypothetical protein